MTIPCLASQIAAAARLPLDAAEFLADYLVSTTYAGGELHVGLGEFGYTTIYGVIYPRDGRWFIISGMRMADGRFDVIDAANGQSAQTLRGCFHFERRCDYFDTFTPEFIPDLPPVVPALPEV